jgi:(p)ppGpp synthase/HD superfamily hydrolase
MFREDPAMLTSMSNAISAEGSGIISCHLQSERDQETGYASITVVVNDADHLRRLIDRLLSLNGMQEVERRSGRRRFPAVAGSRS